MVDVVVIGGGPAGLAAAIKARESGAERVVVLERNEELGGILQQCIHTGFGLRYFREELTGPEYAERFINKAKETGVEFRLNTTVLAVSPDRMVTAVNPKEGLFRLGARAVVMAMGCRERTRGALAIPGERPAGIYTAGTAQRFINIHGLMPGKKVVILGSGDIGLIMARRLTVEGAKVEAVIEMMPHPGGLERNVIQCLRDFGIPLFLNHTVTEVHGRKRVEGVTVARVEDGRPVPGSEFFLQCDTLLLSVGLVPETELCLSAGTDLDPATQGPTVDEWRQTSVPGIFACGNVLHVHDLVDNVTREAEIAGHAAWLFSSGSLITDGVQKVRVLPGRNVRYVVPQVLAAWGTSDVLFFFRVRNRETKVILQVRAGNRILVRKRQHMVQPAEMCWLRLGRRLLQTLPAPKECQVEVVPEQER